MPRVAFVLRSTEVHPDCDELCHTERNQDVCFEAQKELKSLLLFAN